MKRVAIIGAGLAGLTLARKIDAVARVTVLEKSAGFGGRMATRSAPPYAFDHGAQHFTAKTAAFRSEVAEWVRQGVVKSWDISFAEFEGANVVARRDWNDSHPHFVGVPGMNQIGKMLAEPIDVRLNTETTAPQRDGTVWRLRTVDGDEIGEFDWVVSTAPSPQTAALLPELEPEPARRDRMLGCYALLLGVERANVPRLDWEAALIREADISWVSINSSKPGRGDAFSMVVHSTNHYADTNIDADTNAVKTHLLQELERVAGIDRSSSDYCALHRWRYANIPKQAGSAALLNKDQHLAACGDWLIHGRIEAAFTSALTLAESIRHHLQAG